jgi:large subunit ribosomal protein L1
MVKYELHINLKTLRSGPVVRNSIRLPYPVQSDWKIGVICPEGSDIAKAATAAGAVAVGEESLFEAIRKGDFEFDRLICHESSEKALAKANLGKILGPKGLMPNRRVKTIVDDVAKSIRDSAGAVEFRERQGCIHMAIGQLRHTPEQLKANIQAVLRRIKLDCAEISEESPKDIHDVILNTTHGPAMSLNGLLKADDDNILPEELAGVM